MNNIDSNNKLIYISSNNKLTDTGSNSRLIYIIIIIVIFIVIIISFNKYNEYNDTYKHIDTYKFKTGDIVLTNEHGIFGYTISLFSGCIYTHCGIIVDGEKRLIAHSHLLNNSKNDIMPILLIKSELNKRYYNKNSGVIIEHIDAFINTGSIKTIVILPIKNEINNVKMLNSYTTYMNKPYKQSILELVNIKNNLFRNKRNDSSLFCSEFIIEILQYMNIIDKNIISNTISPDELLYLSSHDKSKLFIIKSNINKNMLINSFLYKLLSFIRLPINLINNFISTL